MEGKYSYVDDTVEKGQTLRDAQKDESEDEVLLYGWQCGRGPGIVVR
jgi:hypothetical protein